MLIKHHFYEDKSIDMDSIASLYSSKNIDSAVIQSEINSFEMVS